MMLIIAAMLLIVVAMLWIVISGAIALRRKNMEIDLLKRQRPISDKRWRALNVVDRCDFSPGCQARSHEAGCQRLKVEQ
jgi:uncharacterized protein YneF (UPF0154 family)